MKAAAVVYKNTIFRNKWLKDIVAMGCIKKALQYAS